MEKTKRHGPKELPFIGSGKRFGKDPLQFLEEIYQEFGDVVEYTLLGTPFIAVYNPEYIEHILTKNSANYVKSIFVRERWEPFFGNGVITAVGEDWKLSRKALQPFVSRDKISTYFEIFERESLNYLSTLKPGKVIDIKNDMMNLMLYSLVKILFHSELEDKKIKQFGELFEECVHYFNYTMEPAGIIFKNFPTPTKRRFQKALTGLENLIQDVLKNVDTSDVNMFSKLINSKDDNGNPTFTPKLIRDNLLSFFIAGHETSSLSICYTLFLLAQHPEEMKRVQAELDTVLKGKIPTFEDLDKLHAIKNVINESMRLYPPVGIMGREAVGEDQIGRFKINKGTNIVFPILSIHRSKHFYDKPLEFLPDRWESINLHAKRNEFLPFGTGPRVCMGASFAMMEITTVIAILLQRYSFKLLSSPDLKLASSVSMRPLNDMHLEVLER